MKVLVTGISGFLGSNLLSKLLNEGHYVLGIDNLSMGRMENIENNIDHENFAFLKNDIREQSTFEKLAKDFDVIIHLAAFKIPRYRNAVATLLTNSKGCENVLEFARSISCKCILASTSDVYGTSTHLPFAEDGNCVIGDSKVPRWAYAVSTLFDKYLVILNNDIIRQFTAEYAANDFNVHIKLAGFAFLIKKVNCMLLGYTPTNIRHYQFSC